jgi:hypothetical protein
MTRRRSKAFLTILVAVKFLQAILHGNFKRLLRARHWCAPSLSKAYLSGPLTQLNLETHPILIHVRCILEWIDPWPVAVLRTGGSTQDG